MSRLFPIVLAIVVVVSCLQQHADAFTFDLPAKKYRCFTEEIPSNTWMKLRYAIGSGYAQVVDVKVTDPKGAVVHEELSTNKGTFESYSGMGGDFAVCFYSRMSSGVRATEGMRRTVRLEWNTGTETEQNVANMASAESMRPMELHLRMMLDTTRSLHALYDWWKTSEIALRASNEYINSRVMWFAVVVIGTLVAFGYWQVSHLLRFFRKKRLID